MKYKKHKQEKYRLEKQAKNYKMYNTLQKKRKS